MTHSTYPAPTSASPPPRLRTFVLAFSVISLLAAIALGTPLGFDPAQRAAAQTVLIDYDTDGDNLIEVSTRAQWAAIDHDRDGNGSPTQAGETAWQTAFPDAMTNAGCATTCIGYELAADLDFNGQTFTPIGTESPGDGYAATFKGNGFQIQFPTLSAASVAGIFAGTESTATISGLGVIDPNFTASTSAGGIVGEHRGKLIGSYVVGYSNINSASAGGLVGTAYNPATVAHSYARLNINVGSRSSNIAVGGLIGTTSNGPTCINSYFHGDLAGTATGGRTAYSGVVSARNLSGALSNTGCTGAGNVRGTVTGSIANMRAATAYDTPSSNNPFSGFDDTDEDGNTASVDYWDFVGQYDTPVLKAFGHSVSRQAYDYDMDDDGYIDIRTRDQWAAMDEDRNGDGIVDGVASYISARDYVKGFPGAMNTMGCGAKDHDGQATTPDQPTCTGYEMLNDIDFREVGGYEYRAIPEAPGNSFGQPGVTFDFKGNGYRVINLYYHNGRNQSGRGSGIFGEVSNGARFEGIALWNSWVYLAGKHLGGPLVGTLAGNLVGSYIFRHGSSVGGDGANQNGGMVGHIVATGVLENSFILSGVGSGGSDDYAGFFGFMQNGATCRNSYWIGRWHNWSNGGQFYITAGANSANFTVSNCYANSTFPGGGGKNTDWQATFSQNDRPHGRPYAAMVAATDYDTPVPWPTSSDPNRMVAIYANWNRDENGDGEPDDVWNFGTETDPPALKGYGHDWTFPIEQRWWNNRLVDLCDRTLPVANEIIRHLKNDTWRPGITSRPATLDALTPCTSSEDRRLVTVNQLRDYVVTTPENPIRLDPGRTTPASPRITELHLHDFEALYSASHFNLSGNGLTAIPSYLFQRLVIHQLDLSDNALTSLPSEAFAGQEQPAVETDTDAFKYYGSWVDLSNNRLTSDGLPYRVFDRLSHITGLSLNNNAISYIQTRWFDNLTHLGRRDPDATTLPRIIGLHLGGNEATEHYYYNKAFPADMRQYEETYSGENAGDSLRDAILARIKEPKGLRNSDLEVTDHLDLETTENLQNGMITSGACPDDVVSGPPGSVDVNNMPVPCQEATRWTPPWEVGRSAEVSAPTTSTTGEDGHVVLSFSHRSPGRGELPVTGYQIRYRLLPDDVNEPWMQPWRTVPVDLSSYGTKTVTITVLMPLNFYQFQMRAIFAGTPSTPVTFAQGTWPEGLEGATAQQPLAESGRRSVRVTFTHEPITDPDPDRAAALAITGYQLRYRPADAAPDDPWTRDWHDIDVDVSTPGEKSIIVEPLDEGVRYEFQIRPISAGPVESISLTQTTVLGLPKANAIRPTIREISVRAGQQVRLEVDVISLQDTLKNDLADDADSLMVFRWTESPSGGGTFATPSSDRRVVYTAPDLPGTYTILAEAQPDGICRDHHNTKLGISAEDRARCIATITVRVSRAPGAIEPEADPINPAGLIPTSLTDSAGIAYAVFTPVDGGTFSGENITVTAPAGAIPDQQLLGVAAARSDIPVPAPFPGARLTIAAPYYEVNGVQRTGDAPVTAYNLDDPIRACMPIPAMFRADISDVAVISRATTDGSITILTSSIRQTPTGLAACGNIGQLPATVAVANIGIIEATPEPPAPEEDLPDTGATTPGIWASAWAAIAAAIVLSATTIAAWKTRRRRRQHRATPR